MIINWRRIRHRFCSRDNWRYGLKRWTFTCTSCGWEEAIPHPVPEFCTEVFYEDRPDGMREGPKVCGLYYPHEGVPHREATIHIPRYSTVLTQAWYD